jgi:hypothetical protein
VGGGGRGGERVDDEARKNLSASGRRKNREFIKRWDNAGSAMISLAIRGGGSRGGADF